MVACAIAWFSGLLTLAAAVFFGVQGDLKVAGVTGTASAVLFLFGSYVTC